MSLLAFESVSYRYPGAHQPALDAVTLTVEEGEFVVVAGLSGAGKTALLRAAAGLVPHFHGGELAGRVTAGGLDTRHNGPGELAAIVGSVFQDPETQIVMGSVRAELGLSLENRGEPAAAVARAVEEVALALGIAHLLDRPTHELSGGELQRVALGGALAGRPRAVLLDEPTSQLDPVAGDELVWLLRRLNEEWGTTVLLSEQRLERCLGAADRVMALSEGRLALDAPPADFLEWAADACPALQTPAARMFAAAGLRPAPVAVKPARVALADRGLVPAAGPPEHQPAPSRRRRPWPLRRRAGDPPALRLERVWHEWRGGRPALRGLSLDVPPGQRLALMGRNGAGKSTLLRCAAGLLAPTRGRVRAAGRVALLLQNPGDYLLRERVADELGDDALLASGLQELADRHPRDLSGGQRQRLALAKVLAARRCVAVRRVPGRTDPRHGSRTQGPADRSPAAGGGRGQCSGGGHPRRRAGGGGGRSRGPDGRRRDRGRRLAGRGAQRWLVLRHRDRASPRRCRGRAHACAGGGAADRRSGCRSAKADRPGGDPMTWTLASSFILLVVLAAGFAWYERSRPPAKVVALVATLAALAAISRIAFAPLPSVKPTTDIVLISGLVLGGAPGFCVGALAALTSNLFFGQGPWTPWQMVAWGGVGVAGALLGRLTGRVPGRLALAGACALAGLAFGAVMNLFTFSLLGEHSPAAYAAVSARALPFDLAHAIGNLLFALAFGPALARALIRYRERLEVSWRPGARARRRRRRGGTGPRHRRAGGPGRRRCGHAGGLPAQRAERRRGVRPGAGRPLHPAAQRLGGAGTGRGRAESAPRAARRRPVGDRLHTLGRRAAERHRRAGAHDPGAGRGRRVAAQLRRSRPGGGAGAPPGRLPARTRAR